MNDSKRAITAAEQDEWQRISGEARQIANSITDLLLSVVESKIIPDNEKLGLIAWLGRAEQATSGLPYFCTPQSEWLGGEKWAIRLPHIAKQS